MRQGVQLVSDELKGRNSVLAFQYMVYCEKYFFTSRTICIYNEFYVQWTPDLCIKLPVIFKEVRKKYKFSERNDS